MAPALFDFLRFFIFPDSLPYPLILIGILSPIREELLQQRTMSHVKQLRIHEATVGKRRRANPEEEAQRKQQK